MLLKKICITALFVFSSVSLLGNTLTQLIKTKHKFTFKIPASWKQIPEEYMDSFNYNLKKMYGKKATHFNYGIQKSYNKRWFEFPYLVIQVNKKGAIPEKVLRNVKKIHSSISKSTNKIKKTPLGKLLKSINFGQPVYDEKNKRMMVKLRIKTAGGYGLGVTFMIFTSNGFVQFNCYAKENEFGVILPIYKNIVDSIQLDKGYEYKPPASSSSTNLIRMLLYGGAAIIITLISGFLKKRKQERNQGDI